MDDIPACQKIQTREYRRPRESYDNCLKTNLDRCQKANDIIRLIHTDNKNMDCDYDEVIMDNIFYQTLLQDYRDLFLKCVTEGYIICVPRAGSVSKFTLTFEYFCAHILVPTFELPESHFLNINGEEVRICNRVITVEHEIGHQSSIHILFDETFYTDDDLKYKVLCIEKPIESKKTISGNANRIKVLRTLRECIDFLWLESGSSEIVEKINHLTAEYLKSNCDFNDSDLQAIIDSTNSLYVKCVQTALKCPKFRQRLEFEKSLVTNIKLAVETCMQHNIYNKIIKGISTFTAFEDAHLNKVLRNLSSVQIQDLEVRTELYNAVPNAKFELSKIDGYSTVLGKTGCLKKMFLALSNYSDNGEVVAADDVLQILIFLIIKIGLPNWNAQLKYLKYFRFSTMTQTHDEVSFLITSLEAAIEHIQSEMLIDGLDPASKGMDASYETVRDIHNKMVQYKVDGMESLHSFFEAISNGDLEKVKRCINRENTEENDAYLKLCHPLCMCPKCKNMTSKHKENFPTVNSCDSQGLTPLHIASIYCKSTIVEFLLTSGADPKKNDFNGLTAMHYAAMKGHQNGLLLMAYAGADVNSPDYSLNTPLHYSSNNGHENCVKALIYFCENSGIKLNINGLNSSGDSPLHKASRWGYISIVKILLENGADPVIRNKRKLSPIDVAHNSKILELLSRPCGKVQNYVRIIPFRPMLDHQEEAIADSSSKQTIKGITPNSIDQIKRLEKTLKAIEDGDSNLACYYLGLDVSELESEKDSVLPISESKTQEDKCHPLCRCSKCEYSSSDENQDDRKQTTAKIDRMNVNSCNTDGYTPLHVSAIHGRVEICRVLIRHGALLNVQTRDGLLTPLMLACQHQKRHVAKTLLKSGCNIDAVDDRCNTALHHACRSRDAKMVEVLIEHDPDLTVKNYRNKTALQEAKESMFVGVIKALKGSLTEDHSDIFE